MCERVLFMCVFICFSFSQAPMALFYPAAFGIVGQKMTTLQHRSPGDPEDPHDEHYLLSTQSKQDQVHSPLSAKLQQKLLLSHIHHFSVSIQCNRVYFHFSFSLLNPWKGKVFLSLWVLRVNPAAKLGTRQREETKTWSLATHRERVCQAELTQKTHLLSFCPGSQQWPSLKAKLLDWIKLFCTASTAVVKNLLSQSGCNVITLPPLNKMCKD